jgi:hypothetical protein
LKKGPKMLIFIYLIVVKFALLNKLSKVLKHSLRFN